MFQELMTNAVLAEAVEALRQAQGERDGDECRELWKAIARDVASKLT